MLIADPEACLHPLSIEFLLCFSSTVTSRTHTTTSSDSYTAHRIMQGVPEGPLDFVESSSLPLEMSCDYMNGSEFSFFLYSVSSSFRIEAWL